MKEIVLAEIERQKERIISVSKRIHENPEIGYKEFKAAEILVNELVSDGFTVTRGLCEMPTAFEAIKSGNKKMPTVCFLAEYDALPELGHACGHNLIAASAFGAAIGLAKVLPNLRGSVVVFGTPAEEGYVENAGGKVVMIDRIKRADVGLQIHPGPRYTLASTNAREALEFEFKGRAAHAGHSPDKGINALEAVILTFQGINSLRQHLTEGIRVHGIITKGGISANIVPDHAVARLYVRAPDMKSLEETVSRVKNCAQGASLATGATLSIRKTAHTCKNIIQNRTLAEIFTRNIRQLGMELPKTETKRSSSTDFGNVSQEIPSICPMISVGQDVVLHSREAVPKMVSDEAHRVLIVASKALAMTAYDLLSEPGLIEKAKSELLEYQKCAGC